jgi:hypothetical protein
VGGSNKKAHKEEDKPPAELVFNAGLDIILRLDQSALVGSAVYFLTKRPWEDCVLLYCVENQLESTLHDEDPLESALHRDPLIFTDEELAGTACQYRHYTGDQDSNVAEQLIQLIVSLFSLLVTDFPNSRQQGIIALGGH